MRRNCRCTRNRAAPAIAVVWRAVPSRTNRKNLRRQQDVRRRGREIRARRNRAQIRSGARSRRILPTAVCWRELRDPEFRGERIQDSATRGDPCAHRQAVGRTDSNAAKFTRREFAASALDALRGARRALSRDVLLGFLLHDGGSSDQRTRRSRGRHGRELCRPHRSVRAHSERQPDLLPEPLAATVLCGHGRAAGGARRRACADASPAATGT